jgi:hypothetical protein
VTVMASATVQCTACFSRRIHGHALRVWLLLVGPLGTQVSGQGF